jgi:DNA-directed RNA polymerase subunit RPC12/RpoP
MTCLSCKSMFQMIEVAPLIYVCEKCGFRVDKIKCFEDYDCSSERYSNEQ